jgi:flagellar FliL protein
MATPTAQPQPAPPPATPGRTRRLLVIALIAIVAALLAAGGTWFALSPHATVAHSSVKVPPPPKPKQVHFFPLEAMTVNLLSDDGETHYLRVGLTLKLDDKKTEDILSLNMPEIRSRVLLALSNKHPSDLATLDGKRALARELAALISRPVEEHGKPLEIDGVLFTEFVIQ